MTTFPFDKVYRWGNNPRRAELKGRRCRVLVKGQTMGTILIEFENGEKVTTSWRAIDSVH